MVRQWKTAVLMLLWLSLMTGLLYPLFITGVAQVVFARQADGSLIDRDGELVGSALIGQANHDPRYFWPRPSAVGYDPLPSGATNWGPTSAELAAAVAERAAAIRQANHLSPTATIPTDLLFASASGLDPHISPAAARLQIDRVAAARHLDPEQVADLVRQHTEGPQLGLLGQPRVNVLLLNLALDEVE
ncbi:MAG: potassium-transporting ATPase subunit C [Chloroflexi bacterium]|nr:MAG: potassium-transporting ATPase subunit C [Chloroflexota bacterium]